jgi:hypothetical protein
MKMMNKMKIYPIFMFMCPHVIEGKECECGYTKPEAEPCIKEQIEKHLQSTQYNSKKDS